MTDFEKDQVKHKLIKSVLTIDSESEDINNLMIDEALDNSNAEMKRRYRERHLQTVLKKPEYELRKKSKEMIEDGMRNGIAPKWDLPDFEFPEEDHDVGCFGKREDKDDLQELSKVYTPRSLKHLKGKRNHIRLIQQTEQMIHNKHTEEDDELDQDDGAKVISKATDRLIINYKLENRHFLFEVWKLYIAFVSLFSSLLGFYMAAYMITLGRSEYAASTGFGVIYLLIEISQIIEIVINFFTEYHDEDDDVFVRDFKKIAYNYLCSGFIFDLIACLPFYTGLISAFPDTVSPKVPEKGYNWLYIVFILKSLRSYKAYRITTPKYISE